MHTSLMSDELPPPPLPPKPCHTSSVDDGLPPPVPHKQMSTHVNNDSQPLRGPSPINRVNNDSQPLRAPSPSNHVNSDTRPLRGPSPSNHVNSDSQPLRGPSPSTDRVPRPYEKPLSKYDRMLRTLTPADAPVPPGYEVWEPEFLRQSADDGNDFVLKDAEWFQSGIPREIAEEILQQEGEGSFIVRSSQSNPGCYALSMKGRKGNIFNFLIEEDAKGVYFQVRNLCVSISAPYVLYLTTSN